MTENFFQNEAGQGGTPLIKNASYFRARARESLRGKWGAAIMIGLVAVILGGLVSGSFAINFDLSDLDFDLRFVEPGAVADRGALGWMMDLILIVLCVAAVTTTAYTLFVASPIKIGYQRVNLDLVDGNELQIKTLFSYFKINYWRSIGVNLLFSLLTKLIVILPAFALAWSSIECVDELLANLSVEGGKLVLLGYDWSVLQSHLLWIVIWGCVTVAAGVVSAVLTFTYRFAYTAMAEYPEMGAVEAMRVSRSMMRGNKWRLFCLDISFFGWVVLAAIFTFGVGMLVVYPYREAAIAAFYDDITNRRAAKVTEFPSLNFDDYLEAETAEAETREEPFAEEITRTKDTDEAKAPRTDFGGMPFTAELEFPSLDLDDYPTDGEQK